jgi:GntR family transcriptional regulator, transcriptional repressor for pyruvate dehydrogenase complex
MVDHGGALSMQPDPRLPGEALLARLRARLAAGEALPAERVLAEEFGIKRHRLRSVLLRLREAGELGTPRPGRRPRRPASEDLVRGTNPVEVVELRLMLEPALARLAALRASPLEVARIARAAEAVGDDLPFHLAVAAGARNGLAAEVYAQIRRIGRDARLNLPTAASACPARARQRDAEHRAVAEAIAAREPDAAEAAMRAHLLAVQRRVMERLSPGLMSG